MKEGTSFFDNNRLHLNHFLCLGNEEGKGMKKTVFIFLGMATRKKNH